MKRGFLIFIVSLRAYKSSAISKIFIVLALAMLSAMHLLAQTGSVSGAVSDPQHALVRNAEIMLTQAETQQVRHATTSSQGSFSFTGVPYGAYEITVQADGFEAAQRRVQVGQAEIKVDFDLLLKSRRETVEVHGAPQKAISVDATSGAGVLPGGKILEQPYSINAITSEQIDNLQATTIDDLIKVNPYVQLSQPQSYGSQALAYVRGFKVDTFQALEDGLYASTSLINLEDKERVEFVSGVAGMLYGATSPGGLFNYVLKRPTTTSFYNLTTGSVSNTSAYMHLDMGGPIYKDKIAYRLNLAGQDGGTAIDYQNVRRGLLSAAADWRVTKNLTTSVDFSRDNYHVDGVTAKWTFGSTIALPSALDNSKLWAQKYGHTNEIRTKAGAGLHWDVNRIFTIRGRFTHEWMTRQAIQFTNTVSSANSTYTQKETVWAPWMYSIKAGLLAVDAHFKTAFAVHEVTAAWNARNVDLTEYMTASASVTIPGTFTFVAPVYADQPSYTLASSSVVPGGRTENRNLTFADRVILSPRWTLLAGVTVSDIIARNFSLANPGQITSSYGKTKPSPQASLIYAIKPWMKAYGSFEQGLEKGGQASSTDTNPLQVMPPMESKQHEVGVKANVSHTLLTLALFKLNKAYEYDRTNSDNTTTYVQSGREIHQGLEFTASGRPYAGLSIMGGLTLLDPQLKNDYPISLNGTRPINVSKQMFKLSAEYSIPWVHELTATGGVYYFSRMAANTANTIFVPGAATGDLGTC